MEHFYEAAIEFVTNAKDGERKRARDRADMAQQRLLSGALTKEEVEMELQVFSRYVGIILYWRGYKDAEQHRRMIERIQRTPEHHRRFNAAVTKMLEKNSDAEIAEICAEFERRKVSAEFDVDWRPEEFGPDGRAWTEEPIPKSVERAIQRIRHAVKSRAHGLQRRLLFSLPERKREPRKSNRN